MKYELTNETLNHNGKMLHRIKALKDFGDVREGDLGGWIEKESNLWQSGGCWVYDNAMVYGNAKVYDNAKIRNNAQIYHNALIYNNALVLDDARVCNNAKVLGNAQVFDSAIIYKDATVCDNARVYGNARVCKTDVKSYMVLRHTFTDEHLDGHLYERQANDDSVIEENLKYIKDNWDDLQPKRLKFEIDDEVQNQIPMAVWFACIDKEEGYGVDEEHIGMKKSGELIWLYVSGCSCNFPTLKTNVIECNTKTIKVFEFQYTDMQETWATQLNDFVIKHKSLENKQTKN